MNDLDCVKYQKSRQRDMDEIIGNVNENKTKCK